MLIVGKVLVSEDILERKFACQVNLCKGACCVQGDAGAPLEEEEVGIIEKELNSILPFMSAEGTAYMSEHGFNTIDSDGDLGTVCRPTGECVFVNYDNGIAVCSIEKAYFARQTWYQKPLSCHLYPIRAKQYGEYLALNYHHWDICAPACKAGNEMNIPVHQFLREALVRKLGPKWYAELQEVSEQYSAH